MDYTVLLQFRRNPKDEKLTEIKKNIKVSIRSMFSGILNDIIFHYVNEIENFGHDFQFCQIDNTLNAQEKAFIFLINVIVVTKHYMHILM